MKGIEGIHKLIPHWVCKLCPDDLVYGFGRRYNCWSLEDGTIYPYVYDGVMAEIRKHWKKYHPFEYVCVTTDEDVM